MNTNVKKEIIKTSKAPMGRIPLTQAVRVGDLIFCSGALGLDPLKYPKDMSLPKDVRLETKQVLENLKTVLEEGGSSLDKVVKVTIFMKDIASDFDAVNEVFYKYFPLNTSPARSTVEVVRLALPDARMEVEAVAIA